MPKIDNRIKQEALEWLSSSWGDSPEMDKREGYAGFIEGYKIALQDLEIFIANNEHDFTRNPVSTLSNYVDQTNNALDKL